MALAAYRHGAPRSWTDNDLARGIGGGATAELGGAGLPGRRRSTPTSSWLSNPRSPGTRVDATGGNEAAATNSAKVARRSITPT